MAKVQTTVGPIKGKMGGATFFIQNGQQMMIPSHRRVKNPKTEAQMKQRIRMSNILGLYHHMKGYLQNTFEGTIGNRNAASFFRSYNLMLKPVWITKRKKLYDYCVVAPYVVSNGRFPAIEYTYQDGYFVSNLEIGDLEITDDTTCDELSCVLLNNNDSWASGDTLEVILLRQPIPSEMEDFDFPDTSAISIETNNGSRDKISDLQPMDTQKHPLVPIQLFNKDGYLAVKALPSTNSVQDQAEGQYVYACAIIHTRGSKQSLMASTQSLCLSNTTLYDYCCSEEALIAALKSYKTQDYKF